MNHSLATPDHFPPLCGIFFACRMVVIHTITGSGMAFNQYNLERVHDQQRGGFDVFIYKTDDKMREVMSSGYFNVEKFGFKSPGDSEKVVIVKASDGVSTISVSLSGGPTKELSTVSSSGSPHACSAGALMNKLINYTGDATILCCGDSTGDQVTDLFYKLAEWISENFPKFNVEYRRWATGSDSYISESEEYDFPAGTGNEGYTVTIYNGSIAGSSPDYLMGSRYQVAVKDVPSADLVIFNHGHNLIPAGNGYSPLDIKAPFLVAAACQIMEYHQSAGLIFHGQNPNLTDNDTSTTKRYAQEAIVGAARILGADATNSFFDFANSGDSDAWDTSQGENPPYVHPSEYGHEKYGLPALTKLFMSTIPRQPIGIKYGVKNLLTNGDFTSLDGSNIPDGWTATNATITQEGTIVDSKSYSLKIEPTVTGACDITQEISASVLERLKGRRVTLSVKAYLPDGGTLGRGICYIQANGGRQVETPKTATGRDGWKWVSVSMVVPSDATALRVILKGTINANDDFAYFDRAYLHVGEGIADFEI